MTDINDEVIFSWLQVWHINITENWKKRLMRWYITVLPPGIKRLSFIFSLCGRVITSAFGNSCSKWDRKWILESRNMSSRGNNHRVVDMQVFLGTVLLVKFKRQHKALPAQCVSATSCRKYPSVWCMSLYWTLLRHFMRHCLAILSINLTAMFFFWCRYASNEMLVKLANSIRPSPPPRHAISTVIKVSRIRK